MVDIYRDTIDGPGAVGGKAVGTSAVQFGHTVQLFSGVTIKAAANNSGQIYVGYNAAVTAGTSDDTDGFELSAGESYPFPVTHLTKLWVIADSASQKFYWTSN